MKRLAIIFTGFLLFLSGCGMFNNQQDLVQQEEESSEISIIPSHSLAEDQYKILLPYRPSTARGAITNQITNRVDIDELEKGLRRHSTSVFSPEKYVFEEGQYLTTNIIYRLIDSLNPELDDSSNQQEHRENPRVFSHILEQNFLERIDNRVELVGISLGIALKSVYRFQTEVGGPYYYETISESEMLSEGENIAQAVLDVVREIEELKDVPVMIALFREEEQSSPVPGHFVQKTVVDAGELSIKQWEKIDEKYVLFPSGEAREDYHTDYQKVDALSNKVAEYFPNYVGVVGTGFYVEDELQKLSIEIPIEFFGKGEVIGFTQYTFGLIKEIFSNHFDIEVLVYSSDGPESLIYRNAGDDEPKVHIFH